MALPPEIKQSIFAMGALLNLLSIGMMVGFPAILVPALLKPGSDISADRDQTSWLVSVTGLSNMVLMFSLGPLMHIYGRRVANFCAVIPVLIGWIVTSFSVSLPMLFLGRILHSSATGAVYFNATCVSEFSCPRIRGSLLNMKLLFASAGIITMHLLGYFMNWRSLALIGTVPGIISLIITFYWPDTPDWLVSRGRYEEAETVFYLLRGRCDESEKEIKKLIEEKRNGTESAKPYAIMDFLRKLQSKALWRPVFLQFLGIVIPELGGRVYFPSFSIELAQQLSGDESKGFMFTYIIDAVTAISTICSFYFVKKYKRRQLLLYPGYFSIATLITVSILVYIRTKFYNTTAMMWIILTLICLYFFIMTCTVFAISYVLMGELLPLEYRAPGTVISGFLMCVVSITSIRIMPIMKENLQLHGMFFVYSICMLAALWFLQYDLPETKDRTLQDIADYFKGKSPKVPYDDAVVDSDETEVILEK